MSLFSSGSNAHGQLANGSLEDSHTFLPCHFSGLLPGALPPGTQRILSVTSGGNHTLVHLEIRDSVAKAHTELWGCGDGSLGQLGPRYLENVETTTIFRPIDIPLEQEGLACKLVCASWQTTYIVFSCEKGDVLVSMGSDDFGDLGIGGSRKGKEKQIAKPVHTVCFDHISVDGELRLETARITVDSMAAKQHHVVVHLHATWSDGSSRALTVGWGTSRHGQLGAVTSASGKAPPFLTIPTVVSVDDSGDRVVSVSAGTQHTALLHTSGRVSTLGSNRKAQLEGISGLENVRNVCCTWNGTYVVTGDGASSRILATGSYSHGQLGRPLQAAGEPLPALAPVNFPFTSHTHRVKDMACGSEHVLVLFSVGGSPSITELWGWGWNEHGNLGTGTTDDMRLPIKIWPEVPSADSTLAWNNFQKVEGVWAGSGTSWVHCTT